MDYLLSTPEGIALLVVLGVLLIVVLVLILRKPRDPRLDFDLEALLQDDPKEAPPAQRPSAAAPPTSARPATPARQAAPAPAAPVSAPAAPAPQPQQQRPPAPRSEPSGQMPMQPVAPAPVAAPLPKMDPESTRLHEKARRRAKVLVQEIMMYHNEKVQRGKAEGDVLKYINREVETSKKLFQASAGISEEACEGYFNESLLNLLAGGNPALLGERAQW